MGGPLEDLNAQVGGVFIASVLALAFLLIWWGLLSFARELMKRTGLLVDYGLFVRAKANGSWREPRVLTRKPLAEEPSS